MAEKILNKLALEIVNRIYGLSQKQLHQLIAECQRATETNCAWYDYHLSSGFAEIARIRIDYLKRIQAEKP